MPAAATSWAGARRPLKSPAIVFRGVHLFDRLQGGTMINCKALEVSLDEDVRELSRYLWALGLPHRITEQSGRQIVWVGDAAQIDPLRELYARWRRGEPLPPIEGNRRLVFAANRRFEPWRAPLTCVLVVLSIA